MIHVYSVSVAAFVAYSGQSVALYTTNQLRSCICIYYIRRVVICCISPVASDISGQIQVDRMIKHHINSNNNKEAVP